MLMLPQLALALAGAGSTPYAPPALRLPGDVRPVRQAVELVVDPAAHGERQTVEIFTARGDCHRERVETPVGHWDNPLSDSALREKFLTLATPAVGGDAVVLADLIERLDEPDTLPKVRALLRRSPLRA
jgi:2-methylcitrate dehydratase PrpD